ncbi:DUF2441 domain-containing protein [Sodalis glossinidius]|uniref:DUF2441 domain-containing protein n=1 Tax=Sodalis glossinidius TaxID=63612 RepID=UPI0011D1453F|nr:DUF2441 domain-containing protein [Sodalis glossinidius]
MSLKPLVAHALSIFNSGASYHANNYFFNYQINLVQSEERFGATIEMLLEERRRNSFPEKPSRFQSLFVCKSVRDAAWFRGFSKSPIDTPIFEIHALTGWHRGDMRLLNMNCTPVELSYRLDLYWKGMTDQTSEGTPPFWEILIPLPAKVGKKVQE